MAIYLNTETNEYPRHDGDLELLGWSLGEPLPTNWVEVQSVPQPETSDEQTAYEAAPAEIDGVWTMVWVVRDLTEAEKRTIALNAIKDKVQRGEGLTKAEAALLVV
jgi:hypothetical protein